MQSSTLLEHCQEGQNLPAFVTRSLATCWSRSASGGGRRGGEDRGWTGDSEAVVGGEPGYSGAH